MYSFRKVYMGAVVVIVAILGVIGIRSMISSILPSSNSQDNNSLSIQNSGQAVEVIEGEFVYRNPGLHFKVTLPESFSVYREGDVMLSDGVKEMVVTFLPVGGVEPLPDVFRIQIHVRPHQGKNHLQWADNYPYAPSEAQISLFDRKTSMLSGQPSVEQTESSQGSDSSIMYFSRVVYFVYGDNLYVLQALAKDEVQYGQYRLAFEEFIQSFEFLE